jgi:hypothetical protein
MSPEGSSYRRDGTVADEQIADAIRENAAGPVKASGDSVSFEQHSIQDQIAADRYLASKAASKKPHRGLRFSRIVPPGAE